ncbi:MAG: aldehyde dehydrogenase [Odoribacter sp.]
MKAMIAAQRMYFATGVTKEVEFRRQSLKRLKAAMGRYEERINAALWEDLHKSAYESYLTEISIVRQELDDQLSHVKRWARPRRVATPIQLFGSKSRLVCEPLGVVLIMAPWNYPFQLLLTPLVGALAAGNCVVLKPSPSAPCVAAVVAELVASVFDPSYVTVVTGGREVNTALLAERFDSIFFTGSPELGRVVMRAAAEHLTPVTLELGGKSPCVVTREADLALAARRIAWGKCLNAGQTCVAPDYLLVDWSVKEELLGKISEQIFRFYGEHPVDSPDYPRIVNVEAFDRIRKLMGAGEVVAGGAMDRTKRYIAPTIIDGVHSYDPIMREEIFGPLLPVIGFHSEEEVVEYINAREKPLALYYFGTERGGRRMIACTSSGGVCVNDTVMHLANARLPFGGVGNSGMGRYHGYDSFLTFSNRRSVLYAATRWEVPLRYPPYRHFSWLKRML